jgi:hypothetical protein
MKKFLFFFLFYSVCAQAQYRIAGIIKDASSQKPLPFATIETNHGVKISSDVTGIFQLESKTPFETIIISYIGYQTFTLFTKNKKYVTVNLMPKFNLEPIDSLNKKKNKTISLIQNVIYKEPQNNPQKKLTTFQFKIYNKLVVTANPDSIPNQVNTADTITKTKIDSSAIKFKKLVKKQHLFLMEKVSLFQDKQNKVKETVLGTKMSGFKNSFYEIIGFNLQSFSPYDEKYEFFETKYVSPVSTQGLKDYDYQFLNSIKIEGRTCYTIYFKNKKKRNKNGLEGVLYIDSENFGLAKTIIRIRGILDITSIHNFEFLPEENLWFPVKNEFKVVKGKNDDPLKILGGTIYFDGEYEQMGLKKKKDPTDFSYIESKSYFYEREFNVPVDIDRSSVVIEIKNDAVNKEDAFWNSNRRDSLDLRSKNTYQSLDSLGYRKGIDSKLFFGRKIINGYAPLGFFDFDLRYLISFNNYEGFRFGLGGLTNEKLSKKFRLEGYTAYGLKDEEIKYKIGAATRFDEFSNTWMGINYTDDILEIGSTKFTIDSRTFKIYDPRPINVNTFYHHKSWNGFVESKFLSKSESIWQFSHSEITPLFNYIFYNDGEEFSDYTMTTGSFSLQWNPFSDFMQTPNGKKEIEKRFPIFTLQLTQTIPEFLGNNFDFTKIDFRFKYQKKFINGQQSTFLLQSGIAYGDVPITHLYSSSPNNFNLSTILRRITVAGENSFETMFYNEFFSSRYFMIHAKHGFKRIELFPKVRPSLALVSRLAWGAMDNPDQHLGITYKTLNQGFFESGIELNQILYGFGLGGYYRYGANHLPKFEDNIAIKITFSLDLGL